jgi:hypothetical protein
MHSILLIAKEHQYCYILLKTNKFHNHYSLRHYKSKNILNVVHEQLLLKIKTGTIYSFTVFPFVQIPEIGG